MDVEKIFGFSWITIPGSSEKWSSTGVLWVLWPDCEVILILIHNIIMVK
jgi:hypothetical protein